MLTRWSEEGPRQLSVSGDLSDLCCDVDEATDHRRDPVKAQQSDIEERLDRTVSMHTNKFPICHSNLYSIIQADRKLHEYIIKGINQTHRGLAFCVPNVTVGVPVQVKGCDLCIVSFKVREVEKVYVRLRISGLSAQQIQTWRTTLATRKWFSCSVSGHLTSWVSAELVHSLEMTWVVWAGCLLSSALE